MTLKPNMCTAVLLAGLSLGLAPAGANAQRYSVTVTNLSAGLSFTAIVAATHKPGVHIFTLGQPASVPLEEVAEGGLIADLEAMLRSDKRVYEVTDNDDGTGPTPFLEPGQSATINIDAHGNYDYLTIVSMLLPTNDGFLALNGVPLPHPGEAAAGSKGATVTYYSPGYDAGTELDDELCADIPGPLCGGAGFNPSRAGAPNFVFVHAGIHGIGDIPNYSIYDLRNPVAMFEITSQGGN